MRMANLSLEHGHCDASTLAWAELSLAIGPRFGDHHDGFRFGELAVALVERGDLTRYRGEGVTPLVGYSVLPWTGPLQTASSLLRRALELAQESGDLLYVAFSAHHLISVRLAAGDGLEDVQPEAERCMAFARRAGFGLFASCVFLSQLDLVRALRGQPVTDQTTYESLGFDPSMLERSLDQDSRLAVAACFYWIRRLQARFHAGDYASALEMGQRAEHLLWASPTFFELAEYHFYNALAHARVCDSAPAAEVPRHREALARHHAQLATWAARCAETFGSRAALLAAELARLEHRVQDADRLYEEAIAAAAAAGAPNIEGDRQRNGGALQSCARSPEDSPDAPLACAVLLSALGRRRSRDPARGARGIRRGAADNGRDRRPRPGHGDQGVANDLQRDPHRQACRDADGDGPAARGRRARPPHPPPGRRGTGPRPKPRRSRTPSRCACAERRSSRRICPKTS